MNSMVFYDRDTQVVPSQHNRPLYVTTSIRGVKFRLAMVDLGFLLNIMLVSTLEVVRMSQDKIIR